MERNKMMYAMPTVEVIAVEAEGGIARSPYGKEGAAGNSMTVERHEFE